MKVYLARFIKNKKVAYKIGHTKWFNSIKRFDDEQYNIFDDVGILSDILVSDPDGKVARQKAELVEACIQGMFPKNFRLEEHFSTPDNTFTGLSGITEMFILPKDTQEENMVEIFESIKKRVERIQHDNHDSTK